MAKRKGNNHRADWWDKAKASQPVETTTTLQQDLEAIASEMTGDRTPAGIAAIALDKLADTQDELVALKAENERLREALEETQRERDNENRQKRQVHLAYMMTVEQLALAVVLQTIEGKSTQDSIEMVKELRQSSMDFMGAYTVLSQLQDSAREINLSPEDWDIAYDRLNDAKDKVRKALVPATAPADAAEVAQLRKVLLTIGTGIDLFDTAVRMGVDVSSHKHPMTTMQAVAMKALETK